MPRLSGALGVTVSPMTEDALLLPEAGLRARLVVLLAGRAAEAGAALGRSSGASDDLRRATALAHDAVTSFGSAWCRALTARVLTCDIVPRSTFRVPQ